MSRTAQDVLEFDKLRELLRLRTTCAPGRRAVNALEPGMERATLESTFALIREAGECLRAGRELGFGALADPQGWLERIEGPGMALEPGEFLDAASLLETGGWLRQQFREEALKFPLLAARAASVGDFRDVQSAIRRCVLPNGEISDDLYQKEQQKLEDAKTDIGWGHQIRSYVLDQSRIKDLRTNYEVGNTQAVLDGGLDDFIAASLKQGV